MALLRTVLMGILLAFGCAVPEAAYLRVERTIAADTVRLRLVPAPGVRINARLAPVLELPDGGVIGFSAQGRTADSSYFLTPPEATAPAPASGLIRATVCPASEHLCRVVTLRSGA